MKRFFSLFFRQEPEPLSLWERRLVWAGTLLAAIFVVAAIVIFRPHYGMMDDGGYISGVIPALKEQGLFTFTWNYIADDAKWGMFRPTNPALIYFLYGPAAAWDSPILLFLLNAFCVFSILALNAWAFSLISGLPAPLILFSGAFFFYGYDLFLHPSLQEKLVLLFGALLLIAAKKWEKGHWRWLGLALLASFLGIASKASFLIFVSMAIWIFFWERRGTYFEKVKTAAPLALFACFSVLALAWVAKQGVYTQSLYSLSKVPGNLFSVEGAMFFGLMALGAFTAFWAGAKWSSYLVPVVGLAAFLALFLPWGIKAYIQSITVPMVGMILAAFVFHLAKPWRVPALAIFAVLVILVSGYRSATIMIRLGDIGRLLERSAEFEQAGISTVYVSGCGEGRNAWESYFRKRGLSKLQVLLAGPIESQAIDGKWFLFDGALCVLPGRVLEVPGCKQEAFFEGRMKKSFRLVKFHCSG